jgi:quinone-modifying oxidoreductase subunit QmoB
MDKKLGVYICSGCSIGESLNVDALVQVAQKECKVPVCRTHPFLCGPEGVALIQQDLASDAVNAVAIAACSPRVKTDAFAFDPRMVLERINLREHVIWSHRRRMRKPKRLPRTTCAWASPKPRKWSRWSRSRMKPRRPCWW